MVDLLTISEFARKAGVTRKAVYDRIEKKDIVPTHIGNIRLISADYLDVFTSHLVGKKRIKSKRNAISP